MDDVLLNKATNIDRCLARIDEEYTGHESELETNYTRQDAIILNLQRACEAAIDAAMHLVRTRKLGVPQRSRDAFSLLQDAGILDAELSDVLKKMVGFRNVSIHDYTELNMKVVRSILERRLDDLRRFSRLLHRLSGTS